MKISGIQSETWKTANKTHKGIQPPLAMVDEIDGLAQHKTEGFRLSERLKLTGIIGPVTWEDDPGGQGRFGYPVTHSE